MKTLEPLKITPSKDYGPYEYQTNLLSVMLDQYKMLDINIL